MNVLDIFSGIGGFSLGLERAGFKTVAFCEKDKNCQKILKKHWPETPIYEDVKSLDGSIFEEIFLIAGGFPCQDISVGGAQKGIGGERSGLWKEYARLINEIKPKYAIIENVERLRKNGLGIVLYDLFALGYNVEWHCITANAIGYPHQRDRIWIIADAGRERFNEYTREKRPLPANEKRANSSLYSEGKKCEPKPGAIRPILSRGALEHFRNSRPDPRAPLSGIRRVTNGVPEGLDEKERKERIKQLGNSIIPAMAEFIGKEILKHYKGRNFK